MNGCLQFADHEVASDEDAYQNTNGYYPDEATDPLI